MSDLCGLATFVVTEAITPLGTIAKLPIDYREATLDFTCWLAVDEFIVSIEQHGIVANPEIPDNSCSDIGVDTGSSSGSGCGGTWSIACRATSPPPEPPPESPTPPSDDTNPLEVLIASPVMAGKQATFLVGQGTAGITYGLSFLAVVAPTQRRKAVELLVCVGTPMVDIELATPPPPPPFIFITGNTNLVAGTSGSIFVNNTSAANITIILPALPTVNQNLVIKDVAGNAATYYIVISDGSYNIDGRPNLTIQNNYGWAELTFTGTQWVQI